MNKVNNVVYKAILIALCANVTPVIAEGASNFPTLEVKDYGYNFLEKNNINVDIPTLTTDLFGDKVDYFSGSIAFEQRDLSIPGNFNIPVEIVRKLPDSDSWYLETREFGNWSLAIPYVKSNYVTDPKGDNKGAYWAIGQACSKPLNSNPTHSVSTWAGSGGQKTTYTADPDDYWNGDIIYIPGQGKTKLTRKTGQTYKRYTNKNWDVSCYNTSAGHEGFVVKLDNGFTYEFGQRKEVESIKPFNMPADTKSKECSILDPKNRCYPLEVPDGGGGFEYELPNIQSYLLVTKITDSNDNWVKYEYDNGNLSRIHSSDGREIVISTDPDTRLIESITANNKVWHYGYKESDGLGKLLHHVTQPDAKSWTFNYGPVWKKNLIEERAQIPVPGAKCAPFYSGNYIEIQHPYGAKGTFDIREICHGLSNVSKISKPNPQGHPVEVYWLQREVNLRSLTKKELVIGNQKYSWTYDYSQKPGLFKNENVTDYHRFASGVPGLKTEDFNKTTVTYPDGHKEEKYFNRRKGVGYGNLDYEVVYDDAHGKLQQTAYTYRTSEDHGSSREFKRFDISTDPFDHDDTYEGWSATYNQLKTSKITTLFDGGVSTNYASYYSDFNEYERPTLLKQQGPSGTIFFRTDYQHDPVNGLFNLPTKQYVSESSNFGVPYKETLYKQGTNLPYQEKVFGKLLRTNLYYTDGTLQKTTYSGSNRYEIFNDYYRGKPRRVTLPCSVTNGCSTENNSNKNTIIAKLEINPDGTTKSITDFKGNKTSYKYNDVGWLTSIDYLDSGWADKTIDYQVVSNTDDGLYGSDIPAGSLRQTISQGNSRRISYYDSLLRKIFTVDKDVASSGTTRYQRFEYDHDNKQTLASIPSVSASSKTGTRSEYDALGRLTKQTRTSDNSITRKVYLSQSRMQDIDALGNVTTTKFRAFSSPSYEMATNIDAPDSDAITIAYNLYNQIDSITQGNITESRYYDSLQQLCKSYRPELGASVFGYNAQRQLAWRAEGASVSSSGCSTSGLNNSQKVVYDYNNLGALSLENFPDSTGDKAYGYDENGNLASLSNGFAQWSYGYNSLNLLRSETLLVDGRNYGVQWGYDSLGQRSSVTYPSGRIVAFSPNALGQPTRAGSYATSAKYHPTGSLSSFAFGNGVKYNQSYDSSGRPNQLTQKGSQNVVSLDYGYDNADNLISLIDGIVPANTLHSFDYDGVHRLTQVRGSWGLANFSYDGLGNLLAKSLGNQSLSLNYDTARNRLANIRGSKYQNFSYDNRGNTTSNGRFALGYNLGNQVTSANGSQYNYDGQGRRVKVVSSGGKTTYSLYSQEGQLLHKAEPASTTKKSTDYVYLGKKLIAKVDNAPDIPATPSSIITPSKDTNGSFVVSWSSVNGAAKYTLSERVNGGSWKQVDGNLTVTSKTISGKSTSTYQYAVRACNVAGCGNYKYSSNTTVVRTPGSISYPTSSADGSATISWGSVSGSTSYQLQRLSGSSWTGVYTGSSTSKALTGMAAGSYRFRVRACKGSICGNFKESSAILKVISPKVSLRWLQSSVPTVGSDARVSWTATGADYCTSSNFERGKRLPASGTAWATALRYPTSTVSIKCYFGSLSKTDSASIRVERNSIGGGGFEF